MNILDFKTVEPLFSQERDGEKPFTVRRIDPQDKRFRALSQWKRDYQWGIRITNPATGESFVRRIMSVDYLEYWNAQKHCEVVFRDWKMIIMGCCYEDFGREPQSNDTET